MILAADIGGTKTNLALFDWKTERVEAQRERTFYSKDHATFDEILAEFLKPPEPQAPEVIDAEGPSESSGSERPVEPAETPQIEAACFGIAGPVIGNRCQTTNLPWVVDGAEMAKRFNLPKVRLLNDLEATAHGILVLRPDEMEVLNPGSPPHARTTMALIAAGTGLGEAILFWHGTHYHPMASEGGHADFAPSSDLEIDLLRCLRINYLHVSWERVLSGAGLVNIYEFLRDQKKNEPTWVAERLKAGDPAAVIAEIGLNKGAEICVQALDLFTSIFGAEAGNLALKTLSLSGLYVGGGIGPKLLVKLKEGGFMRGFLNKGRYKRLMSTIPVRVIMNEKTALLGAASAAGRMLQESSS
jgi:glucokinase